MSRRTLSLSLTSPPSRSRRRRCMRRTAVPGDPGHLCRPHRGLSGAAKPKTMPATAGLAPRLGRLARRQLLILPRVALRVGGTWAQDSLPGPARSLVVASSTSSRMTPTSSCANPLTTGASTVTPYILAGRGASASSTRFGQHLDEVRRQLRRRHRISFRPPGRKGEGRDYVYSSTGTASTRPSTTSRAGCVTVSF